MSIDAISGGGSLASAWDYYKEPKASKSGFGDVAAQTPAVASAASSPTTGDTISGVNGGTGRFGQLLSEMQTLFSDYASASGSAVGSIADPGMALSSGGTLAAALMTDLGTITKDLTGIINGQPEVNATSLPAATEMQIAMPASPGGDGIATSGGATEGAGNGMPGDQHPRRHDFLAFSPWSDPTMAQGTPLTTPPNAAIDQLVAKTASPG